MYGENLQTILQLIERAGFTSLEDFSQRSGINTLQIFRILNGLLPKTDLAIFFEFANALKITPNELINLFYPKNKLPAILLREATNSADSPIIASQTETIKQLEIEKAEILSNYHSSQQALEQLRTELQLLQADYDLSLARNQENPNQEYFDLQAESIKQLEIEKAEILSNYHSSQQALEQLRRELQQLQSDYDLSLVRNQENPNQEYFDLQAESIKQLEIEKAEILSNYHSSQQELEQLRVEQESKLAKEKEDLKQDYIGLEDGIKGIKKEIQQAAFHTLESLLIQLPRVISVIQQNPDFPGVKLLPLFKPLTQLLKEWNIEPIESVGAEVIYNPKYHELLDGEAKEGDLVMVNYIGYKQDDQILYKAKISQIC